MGANEKLQAAMHGAQEQHTPSPDDLEKRIKSEVCRVVANASNLPDPIAAQMLGRDLAEPISKIIEAITPLIREAKAEVYDHLAATAHNRFEKAKMTGLAHETRHGPTKLGGAFALPETKENKN